MKSTDGFTTWNDKTDGAWPEENFQPDADFMGNQLPTIPAKSYVAGGPAFQYLAAGDAKPPGGAKVLVLTKGGVCVVGHWIDGAGFLGWAPLPKRDAEKEARIP